MMQNMTEGINCFHLKCLLFVFAERKAQSVKTFWLWTLTHFCSLFVVLDSFSLRFALCALLLKNDVWIVRLNICRKLLSQIGEDVHFVVIKFNIVEILQN